jgi:hypothetical protein
VWVSISSAFLLNAIGWRIGGGINRSSDGQEWRNQECNKSESAHGDLSYMIWKECSSKLV